MKKKILLAVLVVLILLGIGGAYAYFATDAFKTEKELFFTYLSDDAKDEKLLEYVKKQAETAYTNKGEVSIKVNGENNFARTEDETVQMLNNSKITFEGKTDNSKKLAEQTMTMNFSQGFNIPVKIRRDGETAGIQSNLLDSKFIAIRNENLKSLFERFGANSEEIPDKIDFEKSKFTEEEIKTLKDRYFSILNENLEEKLFSKEKVGNQIVITLNMSDKKCADILMKILQTVRSDDIILNKISGMIDEQDFKDNIDDAIDELKDTEANDNNALSIKLYTESKKIKKVEITMIDTESNKTVGNVEILKEENENDLTYTIKVDAESEEDGKISIDFKVEYKGVADLNNVEENYEIRIKTTDTDDEDMDISLNYTNSKTFTTDIELEGINSSNATIINDATDDEIDDLLTKIYENLGLY